jgi:hypothetical protein
MKFRQFTSAALVTALACSLHAELQAPMLQDGTPVRMRISRNLSSADAQVGEIVNFEVLDEVKVGNVVAIPSGAIATATVTDAKSKRSMGRAGHLNVNLDNVRTSSGEKIPLRGIQDAKAGGHVGAMTGAMVATSIVFFPAAPLFLFMKGKDITIPKGHEITAYVNGDFKIDPAKFANSGPVADVSATSSLPKGKPLTNEDVLNLKKIGFGDELILAKVKGSPAAYKLETDDLLALKQAGISDTVIAAMVQAATR